MVLWIVCEHGSIRCCQYYFFDEKWRRAFSQNDKASWIYMYMNSILFDVFNANTDSVYRAIRYFLSYDSFCCHSQIVHCIYLFFVCSSLNIFKILFVILFGVCVFFPVVLFAFTVQFGFVWRFYYYYSSIVPFRYSWTRLKTRNFCRNRTHIYSSSSSFQLVHPSY